MRMKPLYIVDGNADNDDGSPASRYHGFARKIVAGGSVDDADCIPASRVLRFRYEVGGSFLRYHVVRRDKRTGERSTLPGSYLFRHSADFAVDMLNWSNELAVCEGFL